MVIKDWTQYYNSLSKAEIKAPYSFSPDGFIETSGLEGALLVDGAISEGKLQDGAVTTTKIANASITTAKIQDASITNAKISNVSADKITTSTLTAQVNVGSGIGYVMLDGVNNRIIVHDGSYPRIVIGNV